MSQRLKLEIKALDAVEGRDLVVLVGEDLVLSGPAEALAGRDAASLLARMAAASHFKGKVFSGLTLPSPEGAAYERLIVVGLGPSSERGELDFLKGKAS